MEEVIGKFGVPGVNWGGGRMVQFCTEACLHAGNTWFKKKRMNKYTSLRDNGVDEALMDWVLVDKRLKGSLKDVNVLRSWGGVIRSDHFPVVAKLCWKRKRYERQEEQKVKVIRASELLKKEKAEKYKELIEEDWRAMRSRAVGSVEEEWESFRGTILMKSEVCGLRTVGARGRKSEWWCTEVVQYFGAIFFKCYKYYTGQQ
jgi:hypothetical protein